MRLSPWLVAELMTPPPPPFNKLDQFQSTLRPVACPELHGYLRKYDIRRGDGILRV